MLLGCHPGGWDFPWRLQVGVCVGEGEHQAQVYSLQTALGCSAALGQVLWKGFWDSPGSVPSGESGSQGEGRSDCSSGPRQT